METSLNYKREMAWRLKNSYLELISKTTYTTYTAMTALELFMTQRLLTKTA